MAYLVDRTSFPVEAFKVAGVSFAVLQERVRAARATGEPMMISLPIDPEHLDVVDDSEIENLTT